MEPNAYLQEVTRRLVAFDSVTGQPTDDIMAYLGAELERHGCRVRRQPVRIRGLDHVNLVATVGPAAPGGLLLSGHVDVVPFRDQPGWSRDPLELTQSGDRLYGRGVADMKGFIAQCLATLATLQPRRLRRPLAFAFTVDEEVGCMGAEALAPALPELLHPVPLPATAWIGEPTSWARHHAHKGIVQFSVQVRGQGGHSSLPDRGVNAIQVAARAIEAIGRLQQQQHTPQEAWRETFPEAPYPTLNVGTVRGGTAANMIPDACELTLSYRPLPQGDPLSLYHDIARTLGALDAQDCAGGPGRARITVDPRPLVVPGMDCPRDTPLSRALAEALGKPLAEAAPTGAPYATDGGWLAPTGMDVMICGPGELDQAHQPDESLLVTEWRRGPALIRAVVDSLLC